METKLTMNQALLYEVHSHWLAPYISFSWGQELIAMYIAKKVFRKYKRYSHSMEMRKKLNLPEL